MFLLLYRNTENVFYFLNNAANARQAEKTRLKYDIKILNVPYDLINYVLGFKAFKNALSFVFVLILHHKAVRK